MTHPWRLLLRVGRMSPSYFDLETPGNAWRRKIQHQPSCRFSEQAPVG
jgi:hypothetical protein